MTGLKRMQEKNANGFQEHKNHNTAKHAALTSDHHDGHFGSDHEILTFQLFHATQVLTEATKTRPALYRKL